MISLFYTRLFKPSLCKAIRESGASRVAFGSDAPYGMMGVEVAGYRAPMNEMNLAQTEQNMITGGYIEKLPALYTPRRRQAKQYTEPGAAVFARLPRLCFISIRIH